MMKRKQLTRIHLIQLGSLLAMVVLINFIASQVFYRFDLTAEKRYSLSGETRLILKDLDEIVYIRVYLEGDLPAGFARLNTAIRELLDEFRVYAPQNLQYEFIDPVADPDPQIRRNLFQPVVQHRLAAYQCTGPDQGREYHPENCISGGRDHL